MGLFDRNSSGSKIGGGVSGGAQTQTGDAFNVGASAGDDLSIRINQRTTYNYTETDHGAVEKAFEFGDSALDYASEIGNAAITGAHDLAEFSIRENAGILGEAVDVTKDALYRVNESNRLSQQTVLQALDYNQALIREDKQSEQAGIMRALIDNVPMLLIVGGVMFVAVQFKGKK